MKSIGFAVTAIGMMLTTTAAFADAVVSPVNGAVLVSHGQGFTRQAQPVNLKIGDRVMVSQGNTAKITYGDGCALDLLPGAVQVVKEQSPCAYKAQFGTDFRPNPLGIPNIGGYVIAASVVALGAISAAISLGEKNAPFPPLPRPRSP